MCGYIDILCEYILGILNLSIMFICYLLVIYQYYVSQPPKFKYLNKTLKIKSRFPIAFCFGETKKN